MRSEQFLCEIDMEKDQLNFDTVNVNGTRKLLFGSFKDCLFWAAWYSFEQKQGEQAIVLRLTTNEGITRGYTITTQEELDKLRKDQYCLDYISNVSVFDLVV